MTKRELPILRTADAVYSFFFEDLLGFLTVAGPFVAATLAVRIGSAWLALEQRVISAFAAAALSLCFSWLAASMFAVLWHRRILVPDADSRNVELNCLLAYLGRVLLLLTAYAVIVGGLGFIITQRVSPPTNSVEWTLISLAGLGLAVAAALLAGRLSLAFPAAAIGERRMTFQASWIATTHNSWRLLAAAAITVLPMSLVSSFVHRAIDGFATTRFASVALLSAADALFLFAGTALAVGLASFTYRFFTDAGSARDQPPASHFA